MESLTEVRKHLLGTVETLDHEMIHQSSRKTEWSIAQVLEHLYLTDLFFAKAVSRAAARERKEEKVKEKPVHLTSDRTQKVASPDLAQPTQTHTSLSTLVSNLERSREKFLQVIESVDEIDLDYKSMQHPIFGEVSLRQSMELLARHEARHLEQIHDRIKKMNPLA